MDIDSAYLNAYLKEPIYLKQPSGYNKGNNVYLLKNSYMASNNREDSGTNASLMHYITLDLLDQTLPCCILQPKSKKSSHNHDGGK
jgi:hypothetical protein